MNFTLGGFIPPNFYYKGNRYGYKKMAKIKILYDR